MKNFPTSHLMAALKGRKEERKRRIQFTFIQIDICCQVFFPSSFGRHEHVSWSFYWLKTKFFLIETKSWWRITESLFVWRWRKFLQCRKENKGGLDRWVRDSLCRNSETLRWRCYCRRLEHEEHFLHKSLVSQWKRDENSFAISQKAPPSNVSERGQVKVSSTFQH